MAAVLNAGVNALNQIYDLEIDRVNKPKRPLPSGRLSMRDAWSFTCVTYVIALVLAWLVAPGGRHECFWLVLVAAIVHLHLLGAAAADQAARHLGQRHDRDPARRAAQGRGLVVGEDDRRPRALVHRRDLRPLPARRVDDEGLRRHGGRRARRLPDAADHLRRQAAPRG